MLSDRVRTRGSSCTDEYDAVVQGSSTTSIKTNATTIGRQTCSTAQSAAYTAPNPVCQTIETATFNENRGTRIISKKKIVPHVVRDDRRFPGWGALGSDRRFPGTDRALRVGDRVFRVWCDICTAASVQTNSSTRCVLSDRARTGLRGATQPPCRLDDWRTFSRRSRADAASSNFWGGRYVAVGVFSPRGPTSSARPSARKRGRTIIATTRRGEKPYLVGVGVSPSSCRRRRVWRLMKCFVSGCASSLSFPGRAPPWGCSSRRIAIGNGNTPRGGVPRRSPSTRIWSCKS